MDDLTYYSRLRRSSRRTVSNRLMKYGFDEHNGGVAVVEKELIKQVEGGAETYLDNCKMMGQIYFV